ncbi:MAG: DEAD/DEAH box helicase family protein [Acidobacteria bacterium]|nr:DEAD/DEAH box helicase family protein [Acidobacteriota bacterium]
MKLIFDRGTLILYEAPNDAGHLPGVIWDPRIHAWRAPACYYTVLSQELSKRCAGFRDEVRPRLVDPPSIACPDLRPYQAAAVASWEFSGKRGIIALPTGSGKTRVAIAAIARMGARTLCLVPTRALMAQWVKNLSDTTPGPIGEYGDGRRVEQPMTVATFASALRNMETLGNRFDLLVIDEVHHFGTGTGDEILEMCMAPARLGLSATPPEDEVRRSRLDMLVGPEVYRASVEELAGRYLASFELITISVGLTPSERRAYDAEMSVFRPVCRAFFESAPGASWSDFVASAGRSDSGRRALAAWRRSRTIVRYNAEKRRIVNELLLRHHESRILTFAADNDTAYSVAREHLIQPITCDIGKKERAKALQRFSNGELRILVSARVLNEGIDVPAADIAIIAGGSQGSREYVQRVGRVLRPSEGKKAIVYDLVTRDTFEVRRADEHRRALAAH